MTAATFLAAASLAADAPKVMATTGKSATAGKFIGGTMLGKNGQDGWVGIFDETGTSTVVGAGPDHKLHCFGTVQGVGGVAVTNGYCDETDADGDHILWKTTPDLRPADKPMAHGMSQALVGTGKYAGMTGWVEYTCTNSGSPEAYQNACESHGSVTLP